MCGIVGYVGDNFAEIVVVDGLKRLEYRGYDSAGLAVPLDGGLKLLRRVGKIVNLEREVLREPLQAHVGIGHTRWATHGAPTEANTHPHTDAAGHIAVVHNGIIENYLELRRELEAAGHHFTRPPIPRSCPIWLPRPWPGDSTSWRPSGRRSGVSRAAMPSVSSRPSIRT
jgi:glucosamine--fructose-6-phosphate aminotransferase (isomerizing)